MYKIAVIGDYDSIYGFAALGLDIFPVEDEQEAARTIHALAADKYGIIYVTEKLAENIGHEIEKYRQQVTPAVILIPGISGNTGKGIDEIKKSVEQAVGSDILFGNNQKAGDSSK